MKAAPIIIISKEQPNELKQELRRKMNRSFECGKAASNTAGKYINILDNVANPSYITFEDKHIDRPEMVQAPNGDFR